LQQNRSIINFFMKTVYLLSGLGADERVFQQLELPGVEVLYLRWIMPLENETIEAYAHRMCEQVKHENPILVGLSFGGMMAVEMAKIIPVSRVFILSSVKNFRELPVWMRTAGKLRLNKILPIKPFKFLRPIQNRTLGAAKGVEMELADSYRHTVNLAYLRWSVNVILNWKNDWQPPGLVHLHGSNDRMFPIRRISNAEVIQGGTHFMVMGKSSEISAKLQQLIAES
jgi:pimeloyl-ACP methyl ester carboxylesterase